MIPPGCATARERAPDLALGLLDGAERAEVLEHVHECPSCQTLVTELTGVADTLVLLAPEAEPPPGFGRRVIDAMERPRKLRRRVIAAIAAAVAAAAIVSIVTVRVIDADRAGPVAAPTIERAPMMASDGVHVGEVVRASAERTTIAVEVDYALPDGTYDIVVRGRGLTDVLGGMQVTDGRGSWSGSTDATSQGPVSVELVDDDGTPVCRGRLDQL